jgi:hypothetical protein
VSASLHLMQLIEELDGRSIMDKPIQG